MRKALFATILVLSCASFGQTVPTSNHQTFGGLCEILALDMGTEYVALGYGNSNNHCGTGITTPNAETDSWSGFGSSSSRYVNAEIVLDGASYGLTVRARTYDLNNGVWGSEISCDDHTDAVTATDDHYQVAYFKQADNSVTVFDNGTATALVCPLSPPTGYSIALVQAEWFKQ